MIIKAKKAHSKDHDFYHIDDHKSVSKNVSLARTSGWKSDVLVHFCEGGKSFPYRRRSRMSIAWVATANKYVQIKGGQIVEDENKRFHCHLCKEELEKGQEMAIRLITSKVVL